MRSLALNEFTTKHWSAPYEYDPSITIGEASLAVFDIQTGYWWVWLGVGVLAAYAIVFNLIATMAFTFLSCKLPQELLLLLLLLLCYCCLLDLQSYTLMEYYASCAFQASASSVIAAQLVSALE